MKKKLINVASIAIFISGCASAPQKETAFEADIVKAPEGMAASTDQIIITPNGLLLKR